MSQCTESDADIILVKPATLTAYIPVGVLAQFPCARNGTGTVVGWSLRERGYPNEVREEDTTLLERLGVSVEKNNSLLTAQKEGMSLTSLAEYQTGQDVYATLFGKKDSKLVHKEHGELC